MRGEESKEGRPSFLKKRSKKLLLNGTSPTRAAWAGSRETNVFWFFFSKKNFFLLLPIGAQAAPQLVPAGPPTPLITQAQRQSLGLRNGPDSITDLWPDSGRSWLVFSGAATTPTGIAGGATFRLPVSPDLTTITGPLDVIMRADCRDARPANGTACTRFDSDYAGAGTMLPCANGRTLYFYHGENHTIPDGKRAPTPREGWTGIGQATWDPSQHRLIKDGQIAGLNASNAWTTAGAAPWSTGQIAAASGNPSVVPDPTGTYLYLYFGNRSADPAANGPEQQCSHRTCWAVARAPRAAVCAATGTPAPWQILHEGAFTSPALLPNGTGGPFTPLLTRAGGVVDNLANVTYLPARHAYVMAVLQQPGAAIAARISTDGLAWSAPMPLVPPAPPGSLQTYPRILAIQGPGGAPSYALTYVVRTAEGWSNAALLRQPLRFTQ